jgi:hypothetical protein
LEKDSWKEKKHMQGKSHAKEESMKGVKEGKPNHVRVRVLVRYCNG